MLLAGIATSLGKWFLGKGLDSVVDGYKAKLAAGNTTDRLAVELATKDLEAEIARRNAQRDLGIAGMSHPVWWIAWGLFVIPVGVYHAAIFILSTLGIGPETYAVLKVPPDQQKLSETIIASLFLAQAGAGVAGALIKRFVK
jgi:hypothetical protein